MIKQPILNDIQILNIRNVIFFGIIVLLINNINNFLSVLTKITLIYLIFL